MGQKNRGRTATAHARIHRQRPMHVFPSIISHHRSYLVVIGVSISKEKERKKRLGWPPTRRRRERRRRGDCCPSAHKSPATRTAARSSTNRRLRRLNFLPPIPWGKSGVWRRSNTLLVLLCCRCTPS
uniref:Uncharacterized protein n=1 Tax=Leersia perrieri TaxID=77586 RepID=A0A0D9XTK1_9ORYZ